MDESGELHRMICYPDKMWTEALSLFRIRHVGFLESLMGKEG